MTSSERGLEHHQCDQASFGKKILKNFGKKISAKKIFKIFEKNQLERIDTLPLDFFTFQF